LVEAGHTAAWDSEDKKAVEEALARLLVAVIPEDVDV
jgi:hypothetical protein